jgi:hypothetical protein
VAALTAPATAPSAQTLDAALTGAYTIYLHEVVPVTGSPLAALLFSFVWDWQQTNSAKQRGGWAYHTREEITAALGLSRTQQETARRLLVKHGLLELRREGTPCRLWFRVPTGNPVVAGIIANHRTRLDAYRPHPGQTAPAAMPVPQTSPVGRFPTAQSAGFPQSNTTAPTTPAYAGTCNAVADLVGTDDVPTPTAQKKPKKAIPNWPKPARRLTPDQEVMVALMVREGVSAGRAVLLSRRPDCSLARIQHVIAVADATILTGSRGGFIATGVQRGDYQLPVTALPTTAQEERKAEAERKSRVVHPTPLMPSETPTGLSETRSVPTLTKELPVPAKSHVRREADAAWQWSRAYLSREDQGLLDLATRQHLRREYGVDKDAATKDQHATAFVAAARERGWPGG